GVLAVAPIHATFTVLGLPLDTPSAGRSTNGPVIPSPVADSGPISAHSVPSNRRAKITEPLCQITMGRSSSSRPTRGEKCVAPPEIPPPLAEAPPTSSQVSTPFHRRT